MLPVLGFLVSSLFVVGWTGAATAPRWGVLFVLVPIIFLSSKRVALNRGHLAILTLLAFAWASLNWSAAFYDSLLALLQLTWIVLLVWIGSAQENLEQTYVWTSAGVGISSLLTIVQTISPETLAFIPEVSAPAGLFINKNVLAEAAALCLVAMLWHKRWILALLLVPAVTLTFCRAVWLALGLAFVVRLASFSRILGIGAAIGLIVGTWWIVGWFPNAERLAFWESTSGVLNFWGYGFGSFYYWQPALPVSYDFGYYRSEHAHNEYLELAFELGLVGVGLVAYITSTLWKRKNSCEGYLLLVMAVESVFGFPWRMQVTAFLGAIVVGYMLRNRDDLCGSMGWKRILLWTSAERGRKNVRRTAC